MRRPWRSALLSPEGAVALGMAGYARTRFTLRCFGAARLSSEAGTIVAVSHRTDDDVPVLAAALYPQWARAVAGGRPWPTFVTREDLFLRGFLAGWQPRAPLGLRRVLFRLDISRPLERLRCVPVREPLRMRLAELLAADPDRRLGGWLSPELEHALGQRARGLGRPQPISAAEVIDAAYADILLEQVDRDLTPDPDAAWRAHLDRAISDFRRIVEIVRRGDHLVIFPEGDNSPDGRIGPIRPGLRSLARRGSARLIQPVAIAYDPLGARRPRAYVVVGGAIELAGVDATPGSGEQRERAVTAALRASTPLTVGQLAATAVRCGLAGGTFLAEAGDWIDRARATGRPVAPELERSGRHRVLLAAFSRARAALSAGDGVVERLHRELYSAHQLEP